SLYKKRPGHVCKIGPRTLSVMRREVNNSPMITAKQIMERHPWLLVNVFERTDRNTLHRDLLYQWWCAWKKPLVTRRQMTNKVKCASGRNGWSFSKWETVL
ncbi:unnamed protein product, partial [Meganyctiphanes norvegica]